MTKDLYDKLACPYDKHAPLELSVFRAEGMRVVQGLLECTECRRYYPILGGIPVMMPDEFRDASLEAPFMLRWREQIGERFGKGRGFTLPPSPDNGEAKGGRG